MKKFEVLLDLIIKWILIILMAAIVFDVLWQVFTRYVLNNPSSFTEELATFLLIWVALLGSAYALSKKAHLGIDLLSHYVKYRQRVILELTISIITIIIVSVVFVIGGSRLVFITLKLNQISPALQIKMGYVYTAMPIAGILMIYYSANRFLQALKKNHETAQK